MSEILSQKWISLIHARIIAGDTPKQIRAYMCKEGFEGEISYQTIQKHFNDIEVTVELAAYRQVQMRLAFADRGRQIEALNAAIEQLQARLHGKVQTSDGGEDFYAADAVPFQSYLFGCQTLVKLLDQMYKLTGDASVLALEAIDPQAEKTHAGGQVMLNAAVQRLLEPYQPKAKTTDDIIDTHFTKEKT